MIGSKAGDHGIDIIAKVPAQPGAYGNPRVPSLTSALVPNLLGGAGGALFAYSELSTVRTSEAAYYHPCDYAFSNTGEYTQRWESLDLSTWAKNGPPIVTGGQADPLGGTDAYSVEDDNAGAVESIAQGAGFSSWGNVRAEVWVKKDAAASAVTQVRTQVGSLLVDVQIDITDGSSLINTVSAGIENEAVTVTEAVTGWYQAVVSFWVPTSGAVSLRLYPAIGASLGTASAASMDTATFFRPRVFTDAAWPTDAILRSFDFDQELLYEESRTNVITDSIDLTTWGGGATVAVSALAAPDGGVAYEATDGDAAINELSTSTGSLDAGTWTLSSFIEKNTGTIACLIAVGAGATIDGGTIRLQVETDTGLTSVAAGTPSGVTVEDAGDWWRVSYQFEITAAGSVAPKLRPATAASLGAGQSGAPTGTVAFWGVQLEAGAFATSPIRTSGGAASRAAEYSTIIAPAAMRLGRWSTTITPEASSATLDTEGLTQTLFAFGSGGSAGAIYLEPGGGGYARLVVESAGTLKVVAPLTYTACDELTLTFDNLAGTLEISGAVIGDGTYHGTPWTFANSTLYISQLDASETDPYSGLITVPASGGSSRALTTLYEGEDLTFTRASEAALYDPRHGQFNGTDTYTNVVEDTAIETWTQTGTLDPVTGVSDPDGGTDAVTLEDNDGAGFESMQKSFGALNSIGGRVRFRVYVKAVSGVGILQMNCQVGVLGQVRSQIDVSDGSTTIHSVTGSPVGEVTSATDVGDGWWLWETTYWINGLAAPQVLLYPAISTTLGSQVSSAVGAASFYKVTIDRSAAYVDDDTIREEGDDSLFFEDGRTNYVTDSIDLTAWSGTAPTPTVSALVAPDGGVAYDVEDADGGATSLLQLNTPSLPSTGAYVASIFLQRGAASIPAIQLRDSSGTITGGNITVQVDTSDGSTAIEGGTPTSVNVQAAGADWWRLSVGFDVATAGTINVRLFPARTDAVGNAPDNTETGVCAATAWQLEPGLFPTSPIRTDGSSGVRADEFASLASAPAAMRSGQWALSIWPEASSAELSDAGVDQTLFAYAGSGTGYDAIYLEPQPGADAARVVVREGGIQRAASDLITYDRNQQLVLNFDSVAGTIEVSGATTGNGVADGEVWTFADTTLYIARDDSGALPFSGVMGLPVSGAELAGSDPLFVYSDLTWTRASEGAFYDDRLDTYAAQIGDGTRTLLSGDDIGSIFTSGPATVTADVDGTADEIADTSGVGVELKSRVLSEPVYRGAQLTFRFKAKQDSDETRFPLALIGITGVAGNARLVWNTSTGAVTTSTPGGYVIDTATVTDDGAGYWDIHLAITAHAHGTGATFALYPGWNSTLDAGTSDASVTGSIIVKGVDITTDDVAHKTDDTARIFDEDDSLAVEETRTNELKSNRDLTAVAWTTLNSPVVTAAAATGPDGGLCSEIAFASGGSAGQVRQTLPSGTFAGLDVTVSVFLRTPDGAGSADLRIFYRDTNLTTIIDQTVTVTEDWQRFDFTATDTGGTGGPLFALIEVTDGATFYADLGQVEAGGWPTAPIRTSGGSAARAAEYGVLASASVPAAMLSGRWTYVWTPTYSSSEAVAVAKRGSHFAFNNGDLSHEVHRHSTGELRVRSVTQKVVTSGLTYNAGDRITVTIDAAAGTIEIAGALTGNGIHSGSSWTFPAGDVWVGNEAGLAAPETAILGQVRAA